MIPLQAQQNAKITSDAFAEMASWTNSIKKKDEKLKSETSKGRKVVDEIRSRRQRKKHVVKVDSDGSEIESDGEEEKEEQERETMAEEMKLEGNEHFKQNRFQEAVDAYTMAQSLNTTNPVYPANRAMANMKLTRFREAEEDCTRALKHDPCYEKALYRRAQCRNTLGKLEGAKVDYLAVLKLNPNNKMAKSELTGIKERLNKEVKWSFDRPKQPSKIKPKVIQVRERNKPENTTTEENKPETAIYENVPKIEEIVQEPTDFKIEPCSQEDTEESSQSIDAATNGEIISTIIPDIKEEFHFVRPNSSFELERDWRSMSQFSSKVKYLHLAEAATLAALFAPQLPKFLVDICATLLWHLRAVPDDVGRARFALEMLEEIRKVPRFATALFFLLDDEKRKIRELIAAIKCSIDTGDIERAYLI